MTLLLLFAFGLAAFVAVLAFGARTWTSGDRGRALLRALANVAAGLGVLLVLALAAVPAYGHLTGDYRILPVLSGSMEPVMQRGDAAWVGSKPTEQLEEGDVLVFDPPTEELQGRTTIHRVIELVPEDVVAPTDRREGAVYVRTQGDANDAADPWVAAVTDDTVWVQQRTVPHVGTLLTAAGSGNARLLGMLVAAALIATWGVRTMTAQETKDESAQRLARRAQGEAWLRIASGDTTGPAGTTTVDVPTVPDASTPPASRQVARKASKPAAVVMTAVAILLGGAMFASSASVFDSEPLQATLDSSVVSLETGEDSIFIPVSDLLPGDSAQQLLTLENVGEVELLGASGNGDVGLQLLVEGDGASPLVTDTSGGLQLTAERCDQPWTLGVADPQGRPTYSCGGTVTPVADSRPVVGTVDLTNPPFEAYQPGGIDYVRLVLALPETAPPSMAGQSTEVGINVIALQRDGRNR